MPLTAISARRVAGLLAAATLVSMAAMRARAEEPPKDFSPAERALFMTDQFGKVQPPVALRYQFHHAGSLESGFDDKVSLALRAQSNGHCCDATGEFLSGDRKVALPPVEGTVGNPVLLFFLERDIREMERLTKGKSAYFRKRIRMALFQGAQQRDVTLRYLGKAVAGTEFSITPYTDDPNRPKFEKFADKRYVFTLSDAVPGGIFALRTRVPNATAGDGAPPLLADELLIDGADPASLKAGS